MHFIVRVRLRRVSWVVTGYEEKKFFEVTTKTVNMMIVRELIYCHRETSQSHNT
jgi:hypothetical protein